jgi:AcrR family transcriptional regulator
MRSPEVVKGLILAAARDCFAESGFDGTTTRQIAARADVVENLIYKRFGSKTALFEIAVVEPFRHAVDGFLSGWTERMNQEHHSEDMVREYAGHLFDLLEGHSELLLAMVVSRRADHPLQALMRELERIGHQEIQRQGFRNVNVDVLVRLHFGMVAFNAAFGDALYDAERRPGREEVIDEITAFMLHGAAHRPD